MSVPNQPRVVTPQEAQETLRWSAGMPGQKVVSYDSLAHTVATEPDRTRAAVVRAFRTAQHKHQKIADDRNEGPTSRSVYAMLADAFRKQADAIENGADW